MLQWFDAEIEAAKIVHNVDVSAMNYVSIDKDEKQTSITTIPVVDLDSEELMVIQQDPILDEYPGELDKSSPKSHVFNVLITHARLEKANPSIGFSEKKMLKWPVSRVTKLIKLVADELKEVQKKGLYGPEAIKGKPSSESSKPAT